MPHPQSSGMFTRAIIEDVQVKAVLGRYRIRGFGTLRPRTWATFDELTFIPCSLTRIPLERIVFGRKLWNFEKSELDVWKVAL